MTKEKYRRLSKNSSSTIITQLLPLIYFRQMSYIDRPSIWLQLCLFNWLIVLIFEVFASAYFLDVFGCLFAYVYYGLICRFTWNWNSSQFVTHKFSKKLGSLSWNCRNSLFHWIFETHYETRLMGKYENYFRSATKFPEIRHIKTVSLGLSFQLE